MIEVLILAAGLPAAPLEIFPDAVIYRPHLGHPKEPRISDIKFYDPDQGWLWDITLGGRAGALRLTLDENVLVQLEVEGGAFVRLDLDDDRDLLSSEFTYGVFLTMKAGFFSAQIGYSHLSAHLGDEAIGTPNGYSRDELALSLSHDTEIDVRLYGEIAYAFVRGGPAEPWHLQLGAEWSPAEPGGWGLPYVAVHAWLRQENAFAPTITIQGGWQWRPRILSASYRIGFFYLEGPSPHYQHYDQIERQLGIGNWFEF